MPPTNFAKTRIGLIEFPGSNCDYDLENSLQRHFQVAVTKIHHTETTLPQVSGIVLPGGFSYGDYLRAGALASHSRIMAAIKAFANRGGPVLGICNGFQILCETGLLPGALLPNTKGGFVCRQVRLAFPKGHSPMQKKLAGKVLQCPIAHGEGRYFLDSQGLKRLQGEGQIFCQYADETGVFSEDSNPNGSAFHIAGVIDPHGKVMGMMPHPERACDEILGSADGLPILEAFLSIAT